MAKAQLTAEIGDKIEVIKEGDNYIGQAATIEYISPAGNLQVNFAEGKVKLYTPDEVILLVD